MINKKNTNSKKVSIIIPAFNEEKYLPLCLDSLKSLDYSKQDIEIIVVDNGSTDRTREIALEYGAVVFTKPSANISELRNFGVQQSKGEIIAFVDADCAVAKDWLRNASKYFEDNDVVSWGGPPEPPENAGWVAKSWNLVIQNNQPVQNSNWLGTINLFVRKHQFIDIGGFNESLKTCEDVDLSYRLSKFGRIISSNRLKVIHLREPDSIKEFMRKEIWRGISNLKGIISHGLLLKEIPSISIPIYFGIILPALFIYSILSSNVIMLFFCVLFYIAPTCFVLIKILRKKVKASTQDLIKLSILLQAYFMARTLAVVIRKPA